MLYLHLAATDYQEAYLQILSISRKLRFSRAI